MADEQNQAAEQAAGVINAQTAAQPTSAPAAQPEAEAAPERTEDEKMTAAGFRKVRGRWVR